MSNRPEASWEHENVARRVASEREGSAGGTFQDEPFTADECGDVAAAGVGDGGDYVGKYYVGEVIKSSGSS